MPLYLTDLKNYLVSWLKVPTAKKCFWKQIEMSCWSFINKNCAISSLVTKPVFQMIFPLWQSDNTFYYAIFHNQMYEMLIKMVLIKYILPLFKFGGILLEYYWSKAGQI